MRRDSVLAFCKSLGLVILLFLAVYVPAFAVTGTVSRSLAVIVPVTIAITFIIAAGLVALFIYRRNFSASDFGLRACEPKYILFALFAGLLLGLAVAWSIERAHEPGPFTELALPTGLLLLYFGIGAPVQEELIFRGLLQGVLAKALGHCSATMHLAPLVIAILFSVIHLVVGPITAIFALLLGVLAGELRLRSGSLLPAVLVHALFNLCGMF